MIPIIILSLVCGLHVTAGCRSGRLLASTLPDSFSQYQYTAGIYTEQPSEDGADQGMVMYKHENYQAYIFFLPSEVRGARAGGYWMISSSPERNTDNTILLALSSADSPDLVRENWQVYEEEGPGWISEPSFSVQCVKQSVAICSSRNIVLSGLSPMHRVHEKRLGLYVFTEQLFQSRPVFYHEETKEFLFFLDTMWLVGADIGSKQGSMFVMDYAYDPEFITQTWVVFNRKYFAMDEGLKVTCPNVTEVETDVVYEDPDYAYKNEDRRNNQDACSPGHCAHEGSCSVTRNGVPICLCRAGYTGDRCEQVVTCNQPPSVTHGFPLIPPGDSSQDVFPYLSIVKYRCNSGYFLNGDKSGAVCDSNGHWTGVPSCRAVNFDLTPMVLSDIKIKPMALDREEEFPQPAIEPRRSASRHRRSALKNLFMKKNHKQ